LATFKKVRKWHYTFHTKYPKMSKDWYYFLCYTRDKTTSVLILPLYLISLIYPVILGASLIYYCLGKVGKIRRWVSKLYPNTSQVSVLK
jgi:hypothetical protein